MHIGLDTVGMKGEGFAIHVKEGQRVAAGEAIGSFDPELVKTRGLDPGRHRHRNEEGRRACVQAAGSGPGRKQYLYDWLSLRSTGKQAEIGFKMEKDGGPDRFPPPLAK